MSKHTASAKPRVSVLLPCYNGDLYLQEAIDSILGQTYDDFELIVVDDGSTDSSAAIVEEYLKRDARVRLFSKPNGGIVSALNAGLHECVGEFVARMDADDVSFSNRLADQVSWMDGNPRCVCVGGFAVSDLIATSNSSRTTGGHHRSTDLTVFPPKVAVAMHPLVMVRRAALNEVGGYRDGYRHAEDYDLFIRLSRLGSIDNPQIDMLYYRRHDRAVSIRNVKQQEDSAVRAEVDAVIASGGREPSKRLLDAYRELRVFRRNQSVDLHLANQQLSPVFRSLFDISSPSVFSADYLRLRAMIVVALWRWHKRIRK